MPNIEDVLRNNLTSEQYAAAVDPKHEVLCLACAGSGKSRTLAFRIARLLASGSRPDGIVAFTFTEKAADTIKLRVATALEAAGLSPTVLGAMYIGTIHSYCQYVLGEIDARYRQFDVLDDNRLKLFLMSRYTELGLREIRDERSSGGRRVPYFDLIKEVANAWKTHNEEVIQLDAVEAQDATIGRVLRTLGESMRRHQFIDFSSMIRIVVEALRDGDPAALEVIARLEHLMVDEYQDVNPLQEALIRRIHPHLKTLFVVGDDDQAIYSWRGADVRNILGYRDRYPEASVHTLAVNFRSAEPIVVTADRFVAAELGALRYAKNPTAAPPLGSSDYRIVWFPTRDEEAQWVVERIRSLLGTAYPERGESVRGLTPADVAILMRSTRQPEGTDETPRHAPFTHALDASRIPYSLEAGGSIFDRPQVQVLRSTFELLRDRTPTRLEAKAFFDGYVLSAFPRARFDSLAPILTDWGRRIHRPTDGPRVRLYPQQLVHDLLAAYGLPDSDFDSGILQDLGMFSRVLQDVESVYMSIDSASRFSEILNFLGNVAEGGYDTETGEVLRRPNTVSVSTVHKAKGLEFPVVFVVDVEAGRFPKNRHSYEGWLPLAVIGDAISRGAYQSTREEEARLFYTAITRAERFLHISGSARLPGGRKTWKESSFVGRLAHPEIQRNPAGQATGLTPKPQRRRVDETVMPTSYSDIRYYLRCPRDYQLRKSFGFSPPIADLFGFGTTVHAAVCKLHELSRSGAPDGAEAAAVARGVFHLKHVPQSRDPDASPGPYERARDAAVDLVRKYAETFGADFERRRQVEVRFEVPIRQAVISGSIDLMLHEDSSGKILDASVVDFKSVEGGENPLENEDLQWTELSLQVQLYAKAARDVLNENARTGSVHLLKDNQRIDIPVDDAAVAAALGNVEWAVDRIIADDFPMRPHPAKCRSCDFKALCAKRPEAFKADIVPPQIHVPGSPGREMARAFGEVSRSR